MSSIYNIDDPEKLEASNTAFSVARGKLALIATANQVKVAAAQQAGRVKEERLKSESITVACTRTLGDQPCVRWTPLEHLFFLERSGNTL